MIHPENTARHRVPNPIQIQKFLSGMDYPASKEKLIHQAEQGGADQAALDALRRIPEKEYASPTDLSRALGQLG